MVCDNAGFEGLTEVVMKSSVFWDITLRLLGIISQNTELLGM
jgi:hypothetical protein